MPNIESHDKNYPNIPFFEDSKIKPGHKIKAEPTVFTFATALISLPFKAAKTIFRWVATSTTKHRESEGANKQQGNATNKLLKKLQDIAGNVNRFYIEKYGPTKTQKINERTFEITSDSKITGKIIFDDRSKYEGTFEEDLERGISGKGKMTTADNVTYEGSFKHGRLIEGTKTMANGSYAKGTFDDEGKLNGKGEQYLITKGIITSGTFKHGQLVEGTWINEKDGTSKGGTFKNGKLVTGYITGSDFFYNGIFDPNEKIIKGSIKSQKQVTSEGRFLHNKLDGKGTKTLRDGTIEKGNFKLNKLDGEGTKTFPDGTIYKGMFKNGKLLSGSVKMANGDTFTGDFITQRIKRKNGVTEEGIFLADKLIHGKRIRTVIFEGEPTNITFKGYFVNGILEGKGSMLFEDSIIEGDFSHGWLTKGTLRQINGSEVIEVRFVEDVEKGEKTITLPNGVVLGLLKPTLPLSTANHPEKFNFRPEEKVNIEEDSGTGKGVKDKRPSEVPLPAKEVPSQAKDLDLPPPPDFSFTPEEFNFKPKEKVNIIREKESETDKGVKEEHLSEVPLQVKDLLEDVPPPPPDFSFPSVEEKKSDKKVEKKKVEEKKVEEKKGSNLLKEIREGIKLKSVEKRESGTSKPGSTSPLSKGLNLENEVLRKFQLNQENADNKDQGTVDDDDWG